MLSRFFKWLGWKGPSESARDEPPRGHRRSATAHLFEKRPPPAQRKSNATIARNDDFNPYNTGKFDRSASWERISKKQR